MTVLDARSHHADQIWSAPQDSTGPRASHRNMAMGSHLSMFLVPMFFPFIAIPFTLWAIGKGESPFVDDHGREIINLMISSILVPLILGITLIGIPLIPVYYVVLIVNIIRGAVAAGNGEYFRYPVTFRFLS